MAVTYQVPGAILTEREHEEYGNHLSGLAVKR